MRGLGGEVFARLPGRRGSPGGGTGAQIGAVLARENPEPIQNSPFLTPIGPGLAQKSPGSAHGWLGGAWGGIFCGEEVLGGLLGRG